ncbi:uncharacterized protein LOC143478093 [Brachyhypopomus gauderio]|uniref:uncharacterized protein LOC143478093 n=1 Tax=Brachyhypopomus gauderio TaxID=698409 RepID=UPI00404166D6
MDCSIQNVMASVNLRRGQEQRKGDTRMLSVEDVMCNTIEDLLSTIKKATDQIETEKLKNRQLVREYEEIEMKWTREGEEMMTRQKELEEDCKTLQDEKRDIEEDRKQMEECLKEMRTAAYTLGEDLDKIRLRQEIRFLQITENARLREIENLRKKMDKHVEKMKENEMMKRELEEREIVRQRELETERKRLTECQKEVEKMKLETEQERNRMREEMKRELEELTREKASYRLKMEQMVVTAPAKKETWTLRRWWKSLKKNHVLFRRQESTGQEKSSADTAELSSCPGRNNPETRKKSIWRKWFKR